LRDHLRRDRQLEIAFNVAPTQLISDGLVGELRRTAVAAGVSPRRIVVEIMERQEIDDTEKATQVLAELRLDIFRSARTGPGKVLLDHASREDAAGAGRF